MNQSLAPSIIFASTDDCASALELVAAIEIAGINARLGK
jgi:hypothetical protein